MQITYKLEKLESGGFMAYCPYMIPVVVEGETEEEAIKKLASAAKMYFINHPEINSSFKILDLG